MPRCAILASVFISISALSFAAAEQTTRISGTSSVRLVLPPVINSVVGTETNIYFDNIVMVLNPANFAFEIKCDKGNHFAERWSFKPKADDGGEYPIEIVVRDEMNAELARGKSIVRVMAAEVTPLRELSVLLVGDSLTDTSYSHYPQRLIELDERDPSFSLRLIGSRGLKQNPPDGPLRHEGYAGWTAEAFVTFHGPQSRKGFQRRPETGSPFVYDGPDGKPHLNFAKYCDEFNDGKAPDVIFISLGPNDIFRANDETIEKEVEHSLKNFDILIQEFRTVSPQTRIAVSMPPPPTRSQDGFRNYVGPNRYQSRWQYRRNQHRLIEQILARYGARESENIFVVPVYLNLDTVRNYRTFVAPANASTTQPVERVLDGVHPAKEGHYQMADSLFCWLKSIANAAK